MINRIDKTTVPVITIKRHQAPIVPIALADARCVFACRNIATIKINRWYKLYCFIVIQ